MIQELLFNLLTPWKWNKDEVANVINFFIAIGTVGALVYALWQGRRNNRRINDLAEIASRLTHQNELLGQQNNLINSQFVLMHNQMLVQLRPSFEGHVCEFFELGEEAEAHLRKQVRVSLINKGQMGILHKVNFDNDSFQWILPIIPKRYYSNDVLTFHGIYKGNQPFEELTFETHFYATDALGNDYLFVVVSKGTKFIEVITRPVAMGGNNQT